MAVSDIPLAAQTAYADLVDRCFASSFEEAFAEDGSFVVKTVRGRRYWYFQSTNNEGRRQKYVGPETHELLEHIARHKSFRDDERDRRTVVAMLTRSASLPSPARRIGDVVAALERAGVFRHRAVLVGTVAYQTYSAMLGVRLSGATLQTGDVDIAQHRTISIATKDSTPPPLEVLKRLDASFRAQPHPSSRRSTAYVAAGGLRVDFLTPNRGADTEEPEPLPSLATDAQPLRFLDYLIHEPLRAVLLHEAGVPVNVAAPARYALHKLIISQRRREGEKRGKDIAQSEALLNILTERGVSDLRLAWRDAWERGKSWRMLLGQGLGSIGVQLRDRTLRVVGATRSIVPELDLTFASPPVRYDADRYVLSFWGDVGQGRHRCAVSAEALNDHFGAEGVGKDALMRAFRASRVRIEGLIREKYLSAPISDADETLLTTDDVSELRRPPKRK
jgi:hypothetical protein